MTTLIFGILIGACFVLTVENTILLHRNPPKEKPVELTEEQKRKADEEKRNQDEWDAMMNYKGRSK